MGVRKSHFSGVGAKRGFTIVELLVVIGIIVIVATLIVVSEVGGSDGAALSSAQRVVGGVVQGARAQAVLKGRKTRLIIHNDPEDLDKYGRYIGIIYEDTENPQTGEEGSSWIAATPGDYLPKGIYFHPGMSDTNSGDKWNETGFTMQLEYPRATPQSEGEGDEFFYYEFNANGTLTENQNAWIVLKADALIPSTSGGDGYEFQSESDPEFKEFLKAALILRRSGTVTFVRDPEDIESE